MSAGLVAAGGAAAHAGAAGRARRARRDPHVDPCIRRKLTDRERHLLDDLFDHLERLDRRMQRAAARHWETI